MRQCHPHSFIITRVFLNRTNVLPPQKSLSFSYAFKNNNIGGSRARTMTPPRQLHLNTAKPHSTQLPLLNVFFLLFTISPTTHQFGQFDQFSYNSIYSHTLNSGSYSLSYPLTSIHTHPPQLHSFYHNRLSGIGSDA